METIMCDPIIERHYYEDLSVNSPKELASAIAEYTRKTLGTKVSTVDYGNKSSVVFKSNVFTNQLTEKAYRNSLADAGGYFGFVTRVSSDQPDFVVSFSKTF
jgi:hypothetical protein